jgi:hypothetical protein
VYAVEQNYRIHEIDIFFNEAQVSHAISKPTNTINLLETFLLEKLHKRLIFSAQVRDGNNKFVTTC